MSGCVNLRSPIVLWGDPGRRRAVMVGGMSTRMLLALSLLCGLVILGAFAVQVVLAR